MEKEAGLPENLAAIGLMSGTSLDGIDAALIVGYGVARPTPGGRLFEKNP